MHKNVKLVIEYISDKLAQQSNDDKVVKLDVFDFFPNKKFQMDDLMGYKVNDLVLIKANEIMPPILNKLQNEFNVISKFSGSGYNYYNQITKYIITVDSVIIGEVKRNLEAKKAINHDIDYNHIENECLELKKQLKEQNNKIIELEKALEDSNTLDYAMKRGKERFELILVELIKIKESGVAGSRVDAMNKFCQDALNKFSLIGNGNPDNLSKNLLKQYEEALEKYSDIKDKDPFKKTS